VQGITTQASIGGSALLCTRITGKVCVAGTSRENKAVPQGVLRNSCCAGAAIVAVSAQPAAAFGVCGVVSCVALEARVGIGWLLVQLLKQRSM
jgi:hypothetical protein